jgi:putative phosphoesterase
VRTRTTVVGLISDTHGLVRPEALAALGGVGRIVHAGDVGAPAVLAALRAIAPVTAVRGNNDRGAWAARLPERATLTIRGRRLLVIHDRTAVGRAAVAGRLAVVVCGHSHRPAVEHRDGILWVNPGSAGPRRFSLPVTIARLTVEARGLHAEIVPLGVGISR